MSEQMSLFTILDGEKTFNAVTIPQILKSNPDAGLYRMRSQHLPI